MNNSSKTKEQWFFEGYAHYKAGRYKEAILICNHVIELDPDFVLTYSTRGNTYLALKAYQRAIADYDRVIKIDPQFTDAYHNRGVAFKDLQRYDEALADFASTLAHDSNYLDAYYSRGLVYTDLKEYEKAIIEFDYTLAHDSNHSRRTCVLGSRATSRARLDGSAGSLTRYRADSSVSHIATNIRCNSDRRGEWGCYCASLVVYRMNPDERLLHVTL